MAEYQENSSKFLSISSSENGDSIDSSTTQADGGDEEFYEGIEAPKFVDFTVPDRYLPDDRYWFCRRVGCDQKHEEEMDSEAIYQSFILRVMAARSPNVRLRKALDRNASRTPIKCPLSAPPKPSKPRLSRMAIISSISKKMVDDKKRVLTPLSKSGSTPLTKTKPIAAKYLTTPRNKKSITNQSSFRSVQNPKPTNIEVPRSRIVAKALVFRSPKKAIKVKTSVELRTPISKLCEGMKKLEISSQRKRALGYSSKPSKNSSSLSRRQLSSCKVQRKPEEPLQSCTDKSGRSIKSKIKGQLSQQTSRKLLGNDETCSSKNNESRGTKQQLVKKVKEESGLQKSTREEACVSQDLEGTDKSRSEATNTRESNLIPQPTNRQENNSNDGNENITSELNLNNSSQAERDGHEFMDGDDKENAAASDENRIHNNIPKQNGRKIFGLHEKCGQVKKQVTQAHDKNLEGSSETAMKLKKPKATNPKPFRLRTDERRILKEANLERRSDPLTPQSESANFSTPGGRLQRKQGNDIQKGSMVAGIKTPKGQERQKARASMTPECNKHQERKSMNSPRLSNAMQRLEKFRKITSPLAKHSVRPQGVVSTKQEMISYLTPGQKLDVIQEASPEVSESKRAGKPTGNAPPTDDAAARAVSRSSSRGRRPITVAQEPNFHSTHVPRSNTKKLK